MDDAATARFRAVCLRCRRHGNPGTSLLLPALLLPLSCVMLLRFREDVVVRCRFVLVVIRLDIIFAHGMIFKFVPHQYSTQIGMAVEDDSVEVEDLALLKLCAAPNRSERWQMNFVGPVFRTQPENDWTVLFLHRIQVIHGFKMSRRL